MSDQYTRLVFYRQPTVFSYILFFQRDGKTRSGYEIYLWFHSVHKWRVSNRQNFEAKDNRCVMYFLSSGKQITNPNV